jgi:peptide/nickel transport system substrate-binding protein
VPKKYVEANGDAQFALHPIGSGPYKAVEHVAGSYIKLEAVGPHWRTGIPRYKTVYIRLIPEETTRVAMLRQGKLDIADISADRVAEVRKAGFPVKIKSADALVNCWWIEPWGNGPLADLRVREALNVAIDRKEIAEVIFSGLAKPASIPLGFSWSYSPVGFVPSRDLDYAFDPARAKKLLAEAGQPRFEATILSFPIQGFPQADTLVQAIAGYWGNVGVQAKIVPMDYPAARKKWFDRTAPAALACFNQANRSTFGQYAALTKFTAFNKPTGIMHDDEVTRLVSAMGSETDSPKWNEMMVSVFKRMRAQSVDVPIADIDTPYATSKTLPAWDPGTVMYELNLDQLVRTK